MSEHTVVLAGATGHLGGLILDALVQRGARVTAIVRPGTTAEKVDELKKRGVTVAVADYNDPASLIEACVGGDCVVSALSGLRDVIIDAQSALLSAAVKAGVMRFIPSDYCVDYTQLSPGTNRNFDLRREFRERLDGARIAGTSIFSGMFTDLLVGKAPVVLFKFKRILYWQNADQLLDFTTPADAAQFTAAAAIDSTTPRFLRVAGDQVSARGLVKIASDVTGDEFRLFRAGSLGRLGRLIKVMKLVAPGGHEIFPPWQGMQYLHNMFEGKVKLKPLDNNRYSPMHWTSVQRVLEDHQRQLAATPLSH